MRLKWGDALIRSSWGQTTIARLAAWILRFLYKSNQWHYKNKDILEHYTLSQKPFIACFWHGRMCMMPFSWQWKRPFYMMLSAHRDGQVIGKILSFLGISTIVGSTQRKGLQAAKQALNILQKGGYVGITPDGPRGPGQKVSMGIITLGKLAGVDIIPISYASSRRKIFTKSWDHYHLTLPFGTSTFVCGLPIQVDPNACEEKMEEARALLEARLNQLTQEAEHHCGH